MDKSVFYPLQRGQSGSAILPSRAVESQGNQAWPSATWMEKAKRLLQSTCHREQSHGDKLMIMPHQGCHDHALFGNNLVGSGGGKDVYLEFL